MASCSVSQLLSLKGAGSTHSTRSSKGGHIVGLSAVNLGLGFRNMRTEGATVGSPEQSGRSVRCRGSGRLNVSSETFSSPKTGSVGTDRFKEGAAPGTYWNDSLDLGEEVVVTFNSKAKTVTVCCKAGDNLLKLAESSGVMVPTRDFCFEGACCHCEMEVEGGAKEVGFGATAKKTELIRSCLCPVPRGKQALHVHIWNDDEEWGAASL